MTASIVIKLAGDRSAILETESVMQVEAYKQDLFVRDQFCFDILQKSGTSPDGWQAAAGVQGRGTNRVAVSSDR